METIHIILISVAVFTIICSINVYMLVRLRKASRHDKNATKQQEVRHQAKLHELANEIKRLQYVVNDYHEKLSARHVETPGASPALSAGSPGNVLVESTTVTDLMHEKHNLEKEKEQFLEKTKKLWEQSLAIHKEKERIEAMRKEIEKQHKHVTDSILYAQNIQKAMLPPRDYIESLFSDYFILFKPRDIVSGDFYWVNCWDEYLYVAAADCTGHGVPGAFMSMLGLSFINDIVGRQEVPDAAEILEKMRIRIINSLRQDGSHGSSKDGMDIALCIINTAKHEIQYAGAFNSMLHFHGGKIAEYKATKAPVAHYIEMYKFQNTVVPYEQGDSIFLYSDGFADQFGSTDGRKFQLKNLRTLLEKLSVEGKTMGDIKDQLEITFDEWKGSKYKQIDDVLIFGVKL